MKGKNNLESGSMVLVKGNNLPISAKKSIVLCKLLKGKTINEGMKMMENIIDMKKGISLNKREALKVKRGPKYPIRTAQQFVKLLKSLNANANVKGLDVDKVILAAKADRAASPMKGGNRLRKFKRTHVLIEGKLKSEKKGEEKKK